MTRAGNEMDNDSQKSKIRKSITKQKQVKATTELKRGMGGDMLRLGGEAQTVPTISYKLLDGMPNMNHWNSSASDLYVGGQFSTYPGKIGEE